VKHWTKITALHRIVNRFVSLPWLYVSVKVIPYEDVAQLFPYDKVKENLHQFALNPYRPMIRGTGQRPDIFFQTSIAASKFYKQVSLTSPAPRQNVRSLRL